MKKDRHLLVVGQSPRSGAQCFHNESRVAPLKPVTILRMELTAAVVVARMDKLWRRELRLELQDSVFWSDSASTLKYVKNETSRFRVFVANRVTEILKMSNPSQWRYVSTKHNLADLASRYRNRIFFKE